MNKLDIVIVGQQPWDTSLGSNCKDIALEFSKTRRVLYVNSPLDRATSIRSKNSDEVKRRMRVIAGREDTLVPIGENLWNLYPDCKVESINWCNNAAIFNFINRINNRKFAKSISKALVKLGFDDFILFNDNEVIKCFYLRDLLAPRLSIYYSRDYIIAAPYWKKHAKRLEPQVIANSDICVANSAYLMEYCRQYNPKSYYVGQGFDNQLFDGASYPRPEELRDIDGPVIGYVGALHSGRLDINSLVMIAKQRPQWQLVLVGPEDKLFKQSELHSLPNVVFLGSKPMIELAAYIDSFDVCINPQFPTPLTIGNYPRKVDEYLAMGKPVVAFNTPAMDMFRDYTYLANSRDEYVALIDLALEQNNALLINRRKSFVSTHTWAASVRAIYNTIGY